MQYLMTMKGRDNGLCSLSGSGAEAIHLAGGVLAGLVKPRLRPSRTRAAAWLPLPAPVVMPVLAAAAGRRGRPVLAAASGALAAARGACCGPASR